MKKTLLILIAMLALSGCGNTEKNESTQLGKVDLDMPVSRGQAVKMLALSRYTPDEINNMEREINIDDSDISNWCDKYINAAVKAGMISGTQENTFLQNDKLTLEQAGFILNKASDENSRLVLQYDTADRKKPISYGVWLQAFDSIKNAVEEREIVILADNNICPQLAKGYVLSNEGLLNAEGIELDSGYFNCTLKAYMRDKSILAIKEVVSQEAVIKDVLIKEVENSGVLLDIKGCNIFYSCNLSDIVFEKGSVITIKTSGNEIEEILA